MSTLGVSAVVLKEDEILLIKRRDVSVWALPGGGVEANESCAQAAVREVGEETGIEIELTGFVGMYSRPRWRSGGDHTAVFAARPLTSEIRIQVEEVIEAGYFPSPSLPEPFVWWHRQRIADAIGGMVGVCRIQDAVWPFEEGEKGYRQLCNLRSSPAELNRLTNAGPQSEIVEVRGIVRE